MVLAYDCFLSWQSFSTRKTYCNHRRSIIEMSDLENQFREAAEAVKKLKSRPTDGELLDLYALFKQATVGDNKESKPGMFQLKGKAKHEAWLAKKGEFQQSCVDIDFVCFFECQILNSPTLHLRYKPIGCQKSLHFQGEADC